MSVDWNNLLMHQAWKDLIGLFIIVWNQTPSRLWRKGCWNLEPCPSGD